MNRLRQAYETHLNTNSPRVKKTWSTTVESNHVKPPYQDGAQPESMSWRKREAKVGALGVELNPRPVDYRSTTLPLSYKGELEPVEAFETSPCRLRSDRYRHLSYTGKLTAWMRFVIFTHPEYMAVTADRTAASASIPGRPMTDRATVKCVRFLFMAEMTEWLTFRQFRVHPIFFPRPDIMGCFRRRVDVV